MVNPSPNQHYYSQGAYTATADSDNDAVTLVESAEHHMLRILPPLTSHLTPRCAAAVTLLLLPYAHLLQVWD